MGKRWVPLESNPDVLNVFAKGIGAPGSLWSFWDIYGMDPVRTTLLAPFNLPGSRTQAQDNIVRSTCSGESKQHVLLSVTWLQSLYSMLSICAGAARHGASASESCADVVPHHRCH
jgi:Ubiquitin carboxyl-terminal hydrolase, family 1